RSKLPRPEMVVVTVIGSPTCTLYGFASVTMAKLPIAPEKLGGAFGGNGFTSSATGSLLIDMSRRSPNWANGFEKNGSEKGSSKSNKSKGERERGALRLRGTTTWAFAFTGPISNFPARAAAIAVLNVTTSKGLPLIVSKFCDDCCNFCAVNPCPVMSGGSVSLGLTRLSNPILIWTGTISPTYAVFFGTISSAKTRSPAPADWLWPP